MSQFKVGKAKTRDGRDAIVYAIHIHHECLPIHGARLLLDGEFESVNWNKDGAFWDSKTPHSSDLMPNAAPEVYEGIWTWSEGAGVVYPLTAVGVHLRDLVGKRTRVRVEVIDE